MIPSSPLILLFILQYSANFTSIHRRHNDAITHNSMTSCGVPLNAISTYTRGPFKRKFVFAIQFKLDPPQHPPLLPPPPPAPPFIFIFIIIIIIIYMRFLFRPSIKDKNITGKSYFSIPSVGIFDLSVLVVYIFNLLVLIVLVLV